MTRFEYGCENEFQMAVNILFCVACYMEQHNKVLYKPEELKKFIAENQDTIAEWLMAEMENEDE